MLRKVKKLLLAEEAQGMVEYILIVAAVAVLAVGVYKLFGDKLKALFEKKSEEIGNL